MNNFGEKVSFIWSVADLIRGPYRPNQYKDVMLTDDAVEITVFNRGISLFMSEDEQIRRIHRVLCKLNALGKD